MPFTTGSFNSGESGVAPQRELTILLVEDSLRLQTRLTELLTIPGLMRVAATAETESAAGALVDANNFDALVVDVELRQGNGINVVRQARLRWVAPPVPLIIILTNHSLPAIRERCLQAGADHFLDKMRQFDQLHPLILGHYNARSE
jgi:CheY-like chemotaxis protein